MWKLAAPATDSLESDLKSALKKTRRPSSYQIMPTEIIEVLNAYDLYDNKIGRACNELKAESLGKPLLNAIHSAYEQVQDGKRLKTLRNRLKISTDFCPYCGFGEIKDLDHHLPKTSYKAYAIYPKNLIPCCHPCNHKKH